jgi:hypothetical protein
VLIAVVCGCLHQQTQIDRQRSRNDYTRSLACDAFTEASSNRRQVKEEADDNVRRWQQIGVLVDDLNRRLQELELADEHVVSF